jgi:DNA-binding beta-propeller fold protein YncE
MTNVIIHSSLFDSTKFSSWKMNTGLAPTPSKEQPNINNNVADVCVNCTSGDFVKAQCSQCGYLCDNCRMAHQFMHCFEGHEVEPIYIPPPQSKCQESARNGSNIGCCLEHHFQPLGFYCVTCNLPICDKCIEADHERTTHDIQPIDVIAAQQVQRMEMAINEATKKQQEILDTFRFIDEAQTVVAHQQSTSAIHETCENLINVVNELRQVLVKDLEAKFVMKQVSLAGLDKDVQKVVNEVSQMIEFSRRLIANSTPVEIMVFKPLIDTRIEAFLKYDANVDSVDKAINQLDSIHPLSHDACFSAMLELLSQTGADVSSFTNTSDVQNVENSPTTSIMPMTNNINDEDENDLDNHMYQVYPPRSHIKRQKMIYYCKFGEFGVIEGQFTEPSGVAVNCQNDIIVADTNNHRIQVFDREGRFKFQFGECGKRDGQLLYPNRVSVNRVTGDFIVTERSPTHQIQIFNQYGQFMRKFGANILQHPRGVCVDSQGRIIVVECKVMRVIIFDSHGNVLQKFSCSQYLEFPNGVCATPNNEILISDNRAHCIKVFSYEGQYLRQIGGEGITNYPIGVGMNGNGEVIVADNHNNFNLTIFDQKGNMLNALESKVKHAQCFDMALIDDGSVVLASKDYRLYLYRYSHPLTV